MRVRRPRAVRGRRGGRGLRGRGNLIAQARVRRWLATAPRFARHEHTTPSSSSSKPSSCAAAHPAEWSITGTEPPTPDARRIHARPQGCQFRSGHGGGFIARVDRVFYAPAPAFGDHAGRVSKVAVNRIFASPATLVSRSPESSRNGQCRSSSTTATNYSMRMRAEPAVGLSGFGLIVFPPLGLFCYYNALIVDLSPSTVS